MMGQLVVAQISGGLGSQPCGSGSEAGTMQGTWYSAFWGDADRLANRNVLVAAGHIGPTKHTRVFEVARDGQIAWEMRLPNNYGVYRSERIAPPLVRAITQ